jgi:hypothetical protein
MHVPATDSDRRQCRRARDVRWRELEPTDTTPMGEVAGLLHQPKAIATARSRLSERLF